MVKLYKTDNVILNTSEFMEEMLKKQPKTNFSGPGPSHQNGAAERTINTVVTIEINMLIHAALRCTKYTLFNGFGQ